MTDQTTMDVDRYRFDDLKALYINCTLKRTPERSHTQGLIDRSRSIMEQYGVAVDELRAVDHDIATGVWPDMTEHGWPTDEWPAIYQRVLAADILVLCGPIWLGDNSSVTKQLAGSWSPQPGQVVEPLMATRLAPASRRCPAMAPARRGPLPGTAHCPRPARRA